MIFKNLKSFYLMKNLIKLLDTNAPLKNFEDVGCTFFRHLTLRDRSSIYSAVTKCTEHPENLSLAAIFECVFSPLYLGNKDG